MRLLGFRVGGDVLVLAVPREVRSLLWGPYDPGSTFLGGSWVVIIKGFRVYRVCWVYSVHRV